MRHPGSGEVVTEVLLAACVATVVLSHFVFGGLWAINHRIWHTAGLRLPTLIRLGKIQHFRHNRDPENLEHILIPPWGWKQLGKIIIRLSLMAGLVAGAAGSGLGGINEGLITGLAVAGSSALGIVSFIALYQLAHDKSHTEWDASHPLYAHNHMLHHATREDWDSHFGLYRIYEWLMFIFPIVVRLVKLWTWWEGRQGKTEKPES